MKTNTGKLVIVVLIMVIGERILGTITPVPSAVRKSRKNTFTVMITIVILPVTFAVLTEKRSTI